jgi:putative ABC transport system permease protein
MKALFQDLRYALRQLRKSPGFTLAAALTLAVGIGANTAMFSSMDAVVLRPLAVPHLDRVVTVGEVQTRVADPLAGDAPTALANYEDWRRQSHAFENLAIHSRKSMDLTGAGDAAQVLVAAASGNFFSVLKADAFLGHVYGEAECQPGKGAVAVLNYAFWQQHFGSDPGVLGRTVELDERPYTVIGVMPKTLQYPSYVDMFVPLAPTPQEMANRSGRDYFVMGRLRAGVSVKEAQAEMSTLARHISAAYPATNREWTVKVEPLLEGINGPLTNLYYKLIMGATLFVLLVVCANVANLQFARGIARRPEIALRTAMGASRGRIVAQLLTENVLLALVGALGGIAFSAVYLHLTLITMPPRVARYMAGWSNISLNGRALGFSLLIAGAAGIVAGIAPALQALKLNIVDQLKSGSRSNTGGAGGHRLRSIFAVSQLALAVALVIGAALMAKGMQAQLHLGDEYQPGKIVSFNVTLPLRRYDTPEKQAEWYRTTLEKLRTLPGVTHAESGSALPYSDSAWMQAFAIENRPEAPERVQRALRLTVSQGYLGAFHIAVVAGRGFLPSDSLRSQPVAVVSERFARIYFPDGNVLGKRIRMGAGADQYPVETPWLTIVGVVSEARYFTWDSSPKTEVYISSAQVPLAGMEYAVMTEGDAKALAPEVRKALLGMDATIPLNNLMPYKQDLAEHMIGLDYAAAMLGFDALIALLLAAIGIFGVMANMVGERTREIGVRLAMGARREDVLRMVLRRAAVLMAVGLGAGLAMAFGLTHMVAGLLVGVRPDDPLVFAPITAMIAGIALMASWIPARRAAAVDPMVALRDE